MNRPHCSCVSSGLGVFPHFDPFISFLSFDHSHHWKVPTFFLISAFFYVFLIFIRFVHRLPCALHFRFTLTLFSTLRFGTLFTALRSLHMRCVFLRFVHSRIHHHSFVIRYICFIASRHAFSRYYHFLRTRGTGLRSAFGARAGTTWNHMPLRPFILNLPLFRYGTHFVTFVSASSLDTLFAIFICTSLESAFRRSREFTGRSPFAYEHHCVFSLLHFCVTASPLLHFCCIFLFSVYGDTFHVCGVAFHRGTFVHCTHLPCHTFSCTAPRSLPACI